MELRSGIAWLVAALALSACTATMQARNVEQSGFLGDAYPKLQAGPEGGARLVYSKPGVSLAAYDKILLDPVVVWRSSDTQDLSAEDRQHVVNLMHGIVYERLKKDWTMVQTPGSGTLRISTALTSVGKSSPAMDTVSTLLPVGIAASSVKTAATGKPSGVGEAAAEMKITDARTGELLFAAMDKRVGGKSLTKGFDSWTDVENAFQYWADRLAYRLCSARGQGSCVEP